MPLLVKSTIIDKLTDGNELYMEISRIFHLQFYRVYDLNDE